MTGSGGGCEPWDSGFDVRSLAPRPAHLQRTEFERRRRMSGISRFSQQRSHLLKLVRQTVLMEQKECISRFGIGIAADSGLAQPLSRELVVARDTVACRIESAELYLRGAY